MRKILLGSALLLVVCFAAYLRSHHSGAPLEFAYAGNRQVTLMSTTAQVHTPVATVNFGERLEVLERFQDQVKVRTTTGLVGWISERELLSADLWQKARDLDAKTRAMPAMAHGHTKVLTNLHIAPGRDTPRVRQLAKAVPVEFYERQPVEVANLAATAKSSEQEEGANQATVVKKEDWWLVRAHSDEEHEISGWILGRFVSLDIPAPLLDYASSAKMRIVGWFELNRVKGTSGDAKPQYLVLGAHGPEGRPCDFTMLRVYTWGIQRQRYETAFVDNKVCGRPPITITHPSGVPADTQFAFQDIGGSDPEERIYRMHQTIVRRIKQDRLQALRKHR
jgi:hypothetical protein